VYGQPPTENVTGPDHQFGDSVSPGGHRGEENTKVKILREWENANGIHDFEKIGIKMSKRFFTESIAH